MITFIYLIFLFFMGYMMGRNFSVYRYRTKLLEKVSAATRADIHGGRHKSFWRYEAMDSVHYNDMMIRFWKPLGSFYPDKSFMEGGE